METDTAISIDMLINYRPLIWSICHRIILDKDTAQDAAQEAWVEILSSLSSFKGESKLSTWIYSVAYRVIMNYAIKENIYSRKFLKEYLRGGEVNISFDTDIEKKIWVRQMCNKCLTAMLHCLDNESRILYAFHDIVQLSYKEITAIVNKDETLIRQKISRARRRIKYFLNNECVLYNPKGECKCRIKTIVVHLNLPNEYNKLRKKINTLHSYLLNPTEFENSLS